MSDKLQNFPLLPGIIDLGAMLSWPNDATRDFEDVRADLESAVFHLRKNFDPISRKRLFRELRLLLEEADLIINSEPDQRPGRFAPCIQHFPDCCESYKYVLIKRRIGRILGVRVTFWRFRGGLPRESASRLRGGG